MKFRKYTTDNLLFIPTKLGVIKNKIIFEKTAKFSPINISIGLLDAQQLKSSQYDAGVGFKHGASITNCIFKFTGKLINRSELESFLTRRLPRSVRGSSVNDIVLYLLGRSTDSGYTSICHSKELLSNNCSLSKFLTHAISISKRFNKPGILKPAVTLYYLATYRTHVIPMGHSD